MLKPNRRLLTTVVAFVIGCICGGLGGGYYGFQLAAETTSSMAAQSSYYRSIIAVNNAVTALSDVKEGRTSEASKRLELQLDLALSELAAYRSVAANAGCEPNLVKVLSLARAYRANHPSSMQEPSVKTAIDGALRICANTQ